MAGPFQPQPFQPIAFQTDTDGYLSADPASYSVSAFDATLVATTGTGEVVLMNSRMIFVNP